MSRYEPKDHYHQRARREGYRSRAAYKLLEIQRSQRLLRRGQRILDLGCWPGGWLQVAARAAGPSGRVLGVDVAAVESPLEDDNATALVLDFAAPDAASRILDALGGPADVVLCDAAPKLTGIRARDRAREEELLTAVAALLPAVLRPGGDLLLKLLDGPEAQAAARRIGALFGQARTVKPAATRKGSSERYLLAREFAPPAREASTPSAPTPPGE